jgi:hypothetical protein
MHINDKKNLKVGLARVVHVVIVSKMELCLPYLIATKVVLEIRPKSAEVLLEDIGVFIKVF